MMQRFYSWPIRVHLTILIALLAIPSISLIVYSGIAGRHQAISNAKADCLRFVNDAAGQQQAVVVGAEQLATALSLLPPIQSRNPAATNALLADLVRENPQYVNIYVTRQIGSCLGIGNSLRGEGIGGRPEMVSRGNPHRDVFFR